jgi:hypothetical protein
VRIDVFANRRDGTHPLVAQTHRKIGVAVEEIRHFASKELDIGAAKTYALHVDDDESTPCIGHWNIEHLTRKWLQKFYRSH